MQQLTLFCIIQDLKCTHSQLGTWHQQKELPFGWRLVNVLECGKSIHTCGPCDQGWVKVSLQGVTYQNKEGKQELFIPCIYLDHAFINAATEFMIQYTIFVFILFAYILCFEMKTNDMSCSTPQITSKVLPRNVLLSSVYIWAVTFCMQENCLLKTRMGGVITTYALKKFLS